MGPKSLEGYGPLDDAGRAAALRIQDDLTRLLDRVRAYLTQGLGRDLSELLGPPGRGLGGRRVTRRLGTDHLAWRLVEYRPMLDMIVDRLESPTFEVAVFGA